MPYFYKEECRQLKDLLYFYTLKSFAVYIFIKKNVDTFRTCSVSINLNCL